MAWWSGAAEAINLRAINDANYYFKPIVDEYWRRCEMARRRSLVRHLATVAYGQEPTSGQVQSIVQMIDVERLLSYGHYGSLKQVMQLLELRKASADNRGLLGLEPPSTGEEVTAQVLADIDVLHALSTGKRSHVASILRNGDYHQLALRPDERFYEPRPPVDGQGQPLPLQGPFSWLGTGWHPRDKTRRRYAGWRLPETMRPDGGITCRLNHQSFKHGPWPVPRLCPATDIVDGDALVNSMEDVGAAEELAAFLEERGGRPLRTLNRRQFSPVSLHLGVGEIIFEAIDRADGRRRRAR